MLIEIDQKQKLINKLFEDVQKINGWYMHFVQFWIAQGVNHPDDISIEEYQSKRLSVGVGDDYEDLKKVSKKIWNKRDKILKEFVPDITKDEYEIIDNVIYTLINKICEKAVSKKTKFLSHETPRKVSRILSELNKKRI